jgi:hypothetical protein
MESFFAPTAEERARPATLENTRTITAGDHPWTEKTYHRRRLTPVEDETFNSAAAPV